jgi:hypothetical protein
LEGIVAVEVGAAVVGIGAFRIVAILELVQSIGVDLVIAVWIGVGEDKDRAVVQKPGDVGVNSVVLGEIGDQA